MIICATTLLFHVMAKHDVQWTGVSAAWIIAAMMDFGIAMFFIACLFGEL